MTAVRATTSISTIWPWCTNGGATKTVKALSPDVAERPGDLLIPRPRRVVPTGALTGERPRGYGRRGGGHDVTLAPRAAGSWSGRSWSPGPPEDHCC